MVRTPGVAGIPAVLALFLLLAACGGDDPVSPGDTTTDADPVPGAHAILGDRAEAYVDAADPAEGGADPLAPVIDRIAESTEGETAAAELTVDYPLDGSIFPPEFVPPTFLWHDDAERADTWLVTIGFSAEGAEPIRALVPGAPPPEGEIDMEAISERNEIYRGTEYQRSAISWTPGDALWQEIKRRSVESPATVTFTGFAAADPDTPLSRGSTRITTSKDPVGAPFFYRDVPLMAAVGEQGRIKPLGTKAIPLIAWRLRDVSRKSPKLVLKGMPSCGNCHSFSLDGKTLGMDVDGPDGDKGMYAIKPIEEEMVIEREDVITWNSFKEKPEDHRTIGFMSRVSPDGRHVATTLNEDLFIANFVNYKFLQVFYPTRGILGFYSRETDEIRALPGADDPAWVHCSPAWTPNGESIVFSRAKAFDPYRPGQIQPEHPNDPNEPQIRYDLYRIPFHDGKGGEPVPVEGASHNGMSNTFPKVSPDGKWIVWTKCKNGLLMRPDGKLWIVPAEGGEPRKMNCNTSLMNSWHSFSPNSRWMVFSSKSRTPYTQAFLTHIDEEGNDSPAILVPDCTAANRAVNLPEFLNATYDSLDTIEAPVVNHHRYTLIAERKFFEGDLEAARDALLQALETDPSFGRALVNLGVALLRLGHPEIALPCFEKASEADPSSLFALVNRMDAYQRTGRPFAMLECVDALDRLYPTYLADTEKRAQALEAIARIKSEIRAAEAAVAEGPKELDALVRLAELYRRGGRVEDAIDTLEEAHRLFPEAPPVAAQLAWLLATYPEEKIRDGERAVELAESAAEMTGGRRPEPLDILSAAYAETGDFEAALETSERALALARQFAPPLLPVLELRKRWLERGVPIRTPSDR